MPTDLAGLMKDLTSTGFTDLLKGGAGLYNAFNQHKMQNWYKNMATQQWQMQQDIFNREKQSQERRKQLVF